MALTIEKRRVGADLTVLGLTGRITLGRECQELEWQIQDLLKENTRKIVLDFSELRYLDSTGVGSLVMCSGKVRQAGGELSVVGAKGIVEQTLKMTKVDEIVALYANLEKAAEVMTTGSPFSRSPKRSELPSDLGLARVEARRMGDVVVVTCSGRIVAGPSSEVFRDQIKTLLAESRDIVLHLGEVTFIDSSGLGMFVRLLASARAMGGDIKLCHVPRVIQHTLTITSLSRLFSSYETQVEAISAFYQRRAFSSKATGSGLPILCVDKSNDVLAYLRELLLGAGFHAITNNSIHDSLILLTAARPAMVIVGPNPPGEPGQTWVKFRKAATGLPMLELERDFSTREAGEAGARLLETVRALLSSKSRVEATS